MTSRDGHASTRIRLWLACRLLPRGYSIWTWRLGGYEDEPVIEKGPTPVRRIRWRWRYYVVWRLVGRKGPL